MLKRKNVLNIIFILCIIIIFCVVTIYLVMNKKKIVDKIGIRILVIKSGSMYPKIKVNDIVIVKKSNNYNVEDIITYECKEKYLVTHRIIGICENGFITKGDNNNSKDEDIISIEDVRGKVLLIIDYKYLKILIIIILTLLSIKNLKKGYFRKNE